MFTKLQYSTFALAFLGTKLADGQAIYHDIDPDIILDEPYTIANLDLNMDGIYDFGFASFTWTLEYPDYDPYNYVQRLYVGPDSPLNWIAGSHKVYGTAEYNMYDVYFPFALNAGYNVNSTINFQNSGYQRMAFNSTYWLPSLEIWTLKDGGKWIPDVEDRFLGISFVDTLDCRHYGWIRCSVLDNGHTLIIKDYAYETKCDVGIVTGDTVGDTTGTVNITANNKLQADIFVYENNLSIQLPRPCTDCKLFIFDQTSRVILSQTFSGDYYTTKLSLPLGIYYVTIEVENTLTSKNILIK
ncbi:MAG: hypothetical protein R2794_08270 [Chitinophagales bacterium]